VSGTETPLQLRLGAMVVDEQDLAVSMLITIVAIGSCLRRVLRDLLARHSDGIRSREETKSLEL
jgi:hypothetical protein